MTAEQRQLAQGIIAGPPTYSRLLYARRLLRELLKDAPDTVHPLKPRGHAHRDRIVAARINLRRAEA